MSIFSKIWKKLTGWLKPDIPQPERGFNIEKQGTNVAIPVYYGKYSKAPCIKVFKINSDKKGGAKNEYLHLVCIICEGEIGKFGTVYFNGIPESQIDNERYHIERFTGTDNQAACSTLTNEIAQWSSSAKLSGIGYLYVRLRQNKKVDWWNGEPKITVDIDEGKLVYDPRDNQTKFSNNLALCAYDFLTNGRYGKGLPANKINIQAIATAANFIETDRTYTRTIYQYLYNKELRELEKIVVGEVEETVTENIMSGNIRLDTDKSVKENFEILLKGMRGIPLDSDGQYQIKIEKDDDPAYAFTTDNLVGKVVTDGGDQNSRYNQVIIKYRSRLTGEMDEVVFPEDDTLHQEWLVEDGKLLLGEFTFDNIDNRVEALQMGHVIAHRSREDIRVMWQGLPETVVVEVGDVVTIPSSIDGWSGKPVRVESTKEDATTGVISFQGVEHQKTIYPWAISSVVEEYVDTSFALIQNLSPPTGLAYNEALDTDEHMGVLSWADPDDVMVTGYEVEVKDADLDQLVWSTETSQFAVKIPRLPKGSYTATVSAKNALFISEPSELVLASVAPRVPNGLNANAGNFEIILSPTIDGVAGHLSFDLKASDTTTETEAVSLGRARVFVDNNLPPETTRYYWVRSVNGAGESAWSQMFSATTTNDDSGLLDVLKGLKDENFAPDVQGILDRAKIGNELDQLIGFNQVQLADYATDAINALFTQANTNYITQEYLDEFDGFRTQINEDVGQIIVEGGAVKFDEFNAMRVEVDTHNAELSVLTQRQTEIDGTLITQSSQIQQNADEINLLTTSLEGTSFDQLAIRLNQAENELVLSSSSVASANVNLISEIFNGANTTYELVEQGLNLSLAESKITTLSDENQSQAESIELTLALAKDNQALSVQNTQAIADETSARVQQNNVLEASISDEASTRTAAITQVNLAITDETSARVQQGNVLEASISDETSTRTAEITQVNQAIANETSARASQFNQLSTSITYNDQEITSLVTRVNDVEVDSSGNASAIADIIAQIDHPDDGLAAAFIELNAQQNEIDGIKATATIGVTTGGNFTGVYINGTKVSSSITLSAGEFRLWDNNAGQYALQWNSIQGWLFKGRVYAENIDGDITDSAVIDVADIVYDGSNNSTTNQTVVNVTIAAQPFARSVFFTSLPIEWGDLSSVFISLYKNDVSIVGAPGQVNTYSTPSPIGITLPANTSANYKIKVRATSTSGTAIIRGTVLLSVFKQGSTITVN